MTDGGTERIGKKRRRSQGGGERKRGMARDRESEFKREEVTEEKMQTKEEEG